jgi:hypothetical protein
VLPCQQSGSGAQMASTFKGLMSLLNCSIWNNNFKDVEQMIGKAQICLDQNLQNQIAVSPMDLTLNRAKVMLGEQGKGDVDDRWRMRPTCVKQSL